MATATTQAIPNFGHDTLDEMDFRYEKDTSFPSSKKKGVLGNAAY